MPGIGQRPSDRGEEARRDRQVEDPLGGDVALVLADSSLELREQPRVGEVAVQEVQPRLEGIPGVGHDPGSRVGLDRLAGGTAKLLGVAGASSDPDHLEALGQKAPETQVVDRRDQLAGRQISGRTEDHQGGRRRGVAARRPARTGSPAPRPRSGRSAPVLAWTASAPASSRPASSAAPGPRRDCHAAPSAPRFARRPRAAHSAAPPRAPGRAAAPRRPKRRRPPRLRPGRTC